MIKTIEDCRLSHINVPKTVNGMTAWIIKNKRFNDYGVRFQKSEIDMTDKTEMSEHDGQLEYVCKL